MDEDSRAGGNGAERGKRGTFDPRTGEVHGSGSGAGGNGNPREDYDPDIASGGGQDPISGPHPVDDPAHGRGGRQGDR